MAFRHFVDKVLLMLSKDSELNKFQLKCDWDFFYGESLGWESHDYSIVQTWISVALFHKIKELDVCIHSTSGYSLPLSLFTCESLVVLKLDANLVIDAPFALRLPSLKVLHLRAVKLANEFPFGRFLSSFPSLVELAFERIEWESINFGIISAPSLRSLTLDVSSKNHDLFSFVVALIRGAKNIKSLHLLNHCLEAPLHGSNKLPILTNLTHLEVSWSNTASWGGVFLNLLNSAPFLQILFFPEGIFERGGFESQNACPPVPECVKSQVKVIKFMCYRGLEQELNLVKYLLRSAKVLKRMVIDCEVAKRWDPQAPKKLLKLPKASKTCSITFI